MAVVKNILIEGSDGRPIATDIFFEDNGTPKPVVIYAHGFNGFKDWGNFDLVAERFSAAGFVLVKFNFSHNGTVPVHPEDFTDLDAFGKNNYSKELFDLDRVINWVCEESNPYHSQIDIDRLSLIGHSRGGGIVILDAAEDERVKKLVTWASVSECKTPWGGWPDEKMEEWKLSGVAYYTNSRTHQQMPLYYQLYEDFIQNETRLDIRKAISGLHIPVLICHGMLDTAVPVQKAFELAGWLPTAEIFIVESDHVFGRKHPWTENVLPEAMKAVMKETIRFLKG
jgi:pimeloyl-ACP methyl ester carboxylesterase